MFRSSNMQQQCCQPHALTNSHKNFNQFTFGIYWRSPAQNQQDLSVHFHACSLQIPLLTRPLSHSPQTPVCHRSYICFQVPWLSLCYICFSKLFWLIFWYTVLRIILFTIIWKEVASSPRNLVSLSLSFFFLFIHCSASQALGSCTLKTDMLHLLHQQLLICLVIKSLTTSP